MISRLGLILLFVTGIILVIGAVFLNWQDQQHDEAAIFEGLDRSKESLVQTGGYAYRRSGGDRVISGRGSLPDNSYIDIPLEGQPRWVLTQVSGSCSIRVVSLDDGNIQGFRVSGEVWEEVEVESQTIPVGMPPMFEIKEGNLSLFDLEDFDVTPYSSPIIIDVSGGTVFLSKDGDLVFGKNDEFIRLEVDALPDASLLIEENSRVLIYTGQTSVYGHGILGDTIEASRITMVESEPQVRVVLTINLEGNDVFEGLSPIWADITGDGSREIIATVSNSMRG